SERHHKWRYAPTGNNHRSLYDWRLEMAASDFCLSLPYRYFRVKMACQSSTRSYRRHVRDGRRIERDGKSLSGGILSAVHERNLNRECTSGLSRLKTSEV